MTKIQKHIEIVRSSVQNLTSMSKQSADAILAVLERTYTSVGVTIVDSSADLDTLAKKRPDLVFMGMKCVPSGQGSKQVWISEFLESQDIPHTGSAQRAIAYDLSKPSAKQRVRLDGIPTARFIVAKKQQTLKNEEVTLNFPLFVKPANLGGGTGVDEKSYVRNMQELHDKVTSITQDFATDALIEEFLPGREFSVALFRNPDSEELIAMPLELVAPTSGPALSQEVKSANEEIVLAVVDPVLRAQVISVAARAFQALGARDYGRIDIRLDASGVPHFLEANLIPSLISGYGSFPKACVLNLDMDFEAMILNIVNLAFDRAETDSTDVVASLIETSFKPAAAAPIVL